MNEFGNKASPSRKGPYNSENVYSIIDKGKIIWTKNQNYFGPTGSAIKYQPYRITKYFQNPMESFLKYISSISQRLTCSVHQGNKIPFLEIHFRTRLCTILFNLEKKGSNSPTDNQYAHHSYPFSRYKNSDTTTRWCRVQLCYIFPAFNRLVV